MPRLARLDAPGILHHVMGRGIEGNKIFLNDSDCDDFISRLAAVAKDSALAIYAWALLPNHFHLLCKTERQPLASSMRKILTGYAVNFNLRHSRQGHLFQNRYKSIVCQEDRYLKELVRYIHLNLLRAGLVNDFNELNSSPWSGHSALMGKIERNWQDCAYVLSFFGDGRNQRKAYLHFVKQGLPMGHRPELVGGGLIRSLGDWSAVMALRKRNERQASDQRILGDDQFVQDVISGLDDMVKKNLRLSGQRPDIAELTSRICKKHNISQVELCSGSRRQKVVEARRILSWIAVRELGYSGAEVARYLGVTTSCVNRSVSSGIRPAIEDYIK